MQKIPNIADTEIHVSMNGQIVYFTLYIFTRNNPQITCLLVAPAVKQR